ncbi:hypothetical protein BKE38_13015 [Pseudoroseomonas deserti]|uniref:DUF2628 domain-containing protein n=1 Tax=Teichococcus deserti TaxID=1817963 RepID=A0A1V2H3S5_9PROT|nr:DUF2628 domain-containing protein [Pseudoroseomonas deserti]ONG53200.1 hypothetical protein BKE38_13015 [Pseudoroseomonas deserti]
MRGWTVHLPAGMAAMSPRASVPATGAARSRPPAGPGLALVPEGFSFSAFLFGPLWLLRHGQWLAVLLWLAVAVLLALLLPEALRDLGLGLLALLTGLQAQDIRRWTLARQGRPVAGVVLARDADAALARALEGRPDWAAAECGSLQGKPA